MFDTGVGGYRTIHGSVHLQADYQLVIDNLLDLSHAEYLHANTVGTPGSAGSVKTSVDVGPISKLLASAKRRDIAERLLVGI